QRLVVGWAIPALGLVVRVLPAARGHLTVNEQRRALGAVRTLLVVQVPDNSVADTVESGDVLASVGAVGQPACVANVGVLGAVPGAGPPALFRHLLTAGPDLPGQLRIRRVVAVLVEDEQRH